MSRPSASRKSPSFQSSSPPVCAARVAIRDDAAPDAQREAGSASALEAHAPAPSTVRPRAMRRIARSRHPFAASQPAIPDRMDGRERRRGRQALVAVRAVGDRHARRRRRCARGRGRASCRRSSASRAARRRRRSIRRSSMSGFGFGKPSSAQRVATESVRRASAARARGRGPSASCRWRCQQVAGGVELRRPARAAPSNSGMSGSRAR